MTKQRSESDIKNILFDLKYFYLGNYIDENHKRKVIIKDFSGYKYDVSLTSIMKKGFGISFVHSFNPFSLENISLWLKINNKDFELCKDNIYVDAHSKLKFYHYFCKEYFYMGWVSISQDIGCPVCSGHQVGKYNNLKYLRPDLAKEWHPCNDLKPSDITLSSSKKIYWICSVCKYGKNKEWYIQCNYRNRTGCPSCSGRAVSDENRLSKLFPDIALEWNYEKNMDYPENFSYGSNKKVWWTCPKGHEYYSTIHSRTGEGNGCKTCANEKQESSMALELKKYFYKYGAKIEYSEFLSPDTGRPLPYDIYIPRYKIFIEIHGEQHYKLHFWHKKLSIRNNTTPEIEFKKSKHRDKIKKQYAQKCGLYIEIDLRKIKTVEDAIKYIKSKI